jgi:hypothetical protein
MGNMKYALLLFALGVLAMPAFAEKINTSVYANVSNFTALYATECGGNESATVGALPGDFTYGFKRFFENVDTFFTFDKGQSALKHANYGKLRAVEAHLMVCKASELKSQGKDKESSDALDEANRLATDQSDEIGKAQKDLDDGIISGTVNETVASQVRNETRNSITVLQRVYENAPESAKDGLMRALNNSINNYEKQVEKKGGKEAEKNETENETAQGNETGDDFGGKIKNETKGKGNESEIEDETGDDGGMHAGNETKGNGNETDIEDGLKNQTRPGNKGKGDNEADGEDD